MKLDAGLGDKQSVLGSLGFRRDRHYGINVKDFVVGGDLKHQRPDRFDADINIDRLVLQGLEAADEFSELLANAQVIERDLLRPLHDAEQFTRQRHQRKSVEWLYCVARRRMRWHEIGRGLRKSERCKFAALDSLRRRQG